MTAPLYHATSGGHPPQSELISGRAVFTTAYAVIPKGVMRDIVIIDTAGRLIKDQYICVARQPPR